MDVRERLRDLIEGSDDLSYANVAKKAGLSSSAIHKYCTGQVRSMTVDNLERVSSALGVSMRWLMFGEDETNVVRIWDHIPQTRRKQALEVLKTFATNGKA